MPQKITVVNVRLPPDIILFLDKLVKKKIYSSRSEAIREFARQYVFEERDK
ncbi:ribbon-helix-helix protein, CopG family [archaeon]|jgi:metal-responsive CopG/Arc/MetJ family transcriptional regulator|nr:ribbon-helix-helix protein, CopG family [archaeon]MBT4352194.1 ribbon-helix-helix protein, CopG family [archaeon]MBT4647317.1 ribbon-helix-helix protein, CopG family [archaeon]MBT6821247.1 ribbon-helix-helix protein, CopG family [archaeon]MBT7391299.1 ribbon-helix-helix protein, CopG family [archaeon]